MEKAVCPNCGAALNYRAVTEKEALGNHEDGTGAFCEYCAARLIPDQK